MGDSIQFKISTPGDLSPLLMTNPMRDVSQNEWLLLLLSFSSSSLSSSTSPDRSGSRSSIMRVEISHPEIIGYIEMADDHTRATGAVVLEENKFLPNLISKRIRKRTSGKLKVFIALPESSTEIRCPIWRCPFRVSLVQLIELNYNPITGRSRWRGAVGSWNAPKGQQSKVISHHHNQWLALRFHSITPH